MKTINIYCVEFWGNDDKYHQETQWHTSKKYCEEYIEKLGKPNDRRINWANLYIDDNS